MKEITLIFSFIIISFSVQGKMIPKYVLKEKYGSYLGNPVKTADGTKVYFNFMKLINDVPKYTLLEFDGTNTKVIQAPLETFPEGYTEIATQNTGTKPVAQELEYYGFCTLYKGEVLIGYGPKNTAGSKHPEAMQTELHRYKNGKHTPFLISSIKENLVNMAKLGNPETTNPAEYEKIMKSMENGVSYFGNPLIYNSNHLIFEATVNGNSGYYHYDEGALTYLYKAPKYYSIFSNGKTKYYKERTFVYSVVHKNQLFSIVQESKRLNSQSQEEHLLAKELHVYDLKNHTDKILTHANFKSYPKKANNAVYENLIYSADGYLKEASHHLRVINNELFYTGLLTNVVENVNTESSNKNNRYGIFYFHEGQFIHYKLTGYSMDNKLDGFVGSAGYHQQEKIYYFINYKYRDSPRYKLCINSPNNNFQRPIQPMKMKGYRFDLVPHTNPLTIGGNYIFHYKSTIGDDTHFAHDGKRFILYTGFLTNQKGELTEKGYPSDFVKFDGRYYVLSGENHDMLYEWIFDKTEMKTEGFYD
ncbi:hypothetical protein [Crocinitomix algicola]|uniref:hypothetical protein n=1 Tax=Crocinitomix algicola TaxID=1740263 RepID=UPI00082BA491|nr:hypothetical protein [Crocinitomix algicola]